jgi:hypothetical protein
MGAHARPSGREPWADQQQDRGAEKAKVDDFRKVERRHPRLRA